MGTAWVFFLFGVQMSDNPCRALGLSWIPPAAVKGKTLPDLKVSQVWLCPFFSAVCQAHGSHNYSYPMLHSPAAL